MTGGCKQAAARSPTPRSAEKRRTSPHTPLRRKDYIYLSLLAAAAAAKRSY
uniref:Uncharacterized protein n=1 Tax=Myoviridae sp. ctlnK45 TaxID=2826693 RepID=A0A8S5NQ78_9CAUD|nr:MAG TPA: hypothetical protein [Myoviridae sp. ctlnK45]